MVFSNNTYDKNCTCCFLANYNIRAKTKDSVRWVAWTYGTEDSMTISVYIKKDNWLKTQKYRVIVMNKYRMRYKLNQRLQEM